MNRYDIEREAIKQYGEPMQVVVCMEECAELIVELQRVLDVTEVKGVEEAHLEKVFRCAIQIKRICKLLRETKGSVKFNNRDNRTHIREELADVSVMLEQMKMIFGPTDVEEYAKLMRLAGRLGLTEVEE